MKKKYKVSINNFYNSFSHKFMQDNDNSYYLKLKIRIKNNVINTIPQYYSHGKAVEVLF